MALQDAAQQYALDSVLDVTHHGTRNGWDADWEVHIEILLTTGGPHCHIEATGDQLVRVIYSQAGMSPQGLILTDDEREAIAWFVLARSLTAAHCAGQPRNIAGFFIVYTGDVSAGA